MSAVWLILIVLPFALVYLLDRQAKRRAWRLGKWSQRLGTKATVWVHGMQMDLDGWCENCGTSWRYALPHVTFLRRGPSAPTTAIAVVCAKCRRDLPLDLLVRRYAEWWVAKNERMIANNEIPDPGEFDDIKAALRVGG